MYLQRAFNCVAGEVGDSCKQSHMPDTNSNFFSVLDPISIPFIHFSRIYKIETKYSTLIWFGYSLV